MMMKIVHQGILTLIRSALHDEKLSMPEGFSLQDADSLIRDQSLVPLICFGLFNCGYDVSDPLVQAYQAWYFKHFTLSDRQVRTVERICAAFEENGIDYMLLKGCNMKKLYPKQEMRVMGDADVLIRLEQYEQIKPIMQELGFEKVKESTYDFCWKAKALYLELHKRLFDPNQVDLCGYFGTGWEKAHRESGCRFSMTREDEYVYIFTHMAKHFRHCGIGIRHLVDLYVYHRAYPDMDERQVEKTLEQLQMLDFYRNLRRAFRVWFEDAPSDPVTELITEYVFNSGSFGSEKNKLYVEGIINAAQKKHTGSSRVRSIFREIFFPLERMQLSYNILYKYPILYPFFWPVRWVDILLHRRKNINMKLQIIRDMTDERMEDHQQAMNLMGLSLNYMDSD